MTSQMAIVRCGGEGKLNPELTLDNTSNCISPCAAYQELLGISPTKPDVLIYVHDDVTIHEADWRSEVMSLFHNKDCVVVGLGGATSLGRPDLYRRPYRIENMARGGYCSNQTDAEVHGERFTGSKRVAVVDAFFLAVRRQFLLDIGGWPVAHLSHHCLDLWIACEAARHNKETFMTGISCTHYGGGTSTKGIYQKASWLQGGSTETDHQIPHWWLYDSYRDVLPINL